MQHASSTQGLPWRQGRDDVIAIIGARTLKVRPTTRRTLRALGGRRIVVEGFGRNAPAFVAIAGGGAVPVGAWLTRTALRRFVETAKRILK
jgi:hypothetical protein